MKESTRFIAHPAPFCYDFCREEPAPLFRRHFSVKANLQKATLSICALGMGEVWFNGKPATTDRLISPVSEYTKTLWYTTYDVTALLQEGENVAAAVLGNGFFNESLHTAWGWEQAAWRDVPKMLFELELQYADGSEWVCSDAEWICNRDKSPYRFNQLRFGEEYDARYDTDWMTAEYDDSDWEAVVYVDSPGGTLRLCPAPPVCEDRVYPCIETFRNRAGKWVFDFGQNMSGYVRLRTQQPEGTRLRIVYAEELDADGERLDNELHMFYKDGETQFNEIVCNGEPLDWRPGLSYYGFRYVIISGVLNEIDQRDISGVFVHQDVRITGHFHCSEQLFNKLYRMARSASLSNFCHTVTDCPTREKMGWTNDAAASAEQMMQNMDMVSFYEKWMQDIFDAMNDEGDLPGTVPTAWWGYEWGNGPTSSSVLYEIPYRLYQYTGDNTMLRKAYPYFLRYLKFLQTKIDPETNLCSYGLPEWAGPFKHDDQMPMPLEFSCTVLLIRFCRLTAFVAKLTGDADGLAYVQKLEEEAVNAFNRAYILPDGRCSVSEQSALCMAIVHGLYPDLDVIRQQLIEAIERHDSHLYVGMLGMQFLLPACDICGLQEKGYDMLAARGYPSYRIWTEIDATTMTEHFDSHASLNHHMFSCIIAWFHNTILGIRQTAETVKTRHLSLEPYFLKKLNYANGSYDTAIGTVQVDWQRNGDAVDLYIVLPEDVTATLRLTNYTFEDGKDVAELNGGRIHLTATKTAE